MRVVGIQRPSSPALVLKFPLRAEMRERLRTRLESEEQGLSPMAALRHDGWYHEAAVEEDRARREREGVRSH